MSPSLPLALLLSSAECLGLPGASLSSLPCPTTPLCEMSKAEELGDLLKAGVLPYIRRTAHTPSAAPRKAGTKELELSGMRIYSFSRHCGLVWGEGKKGVSGNPSLALTLPHYICFLPST